MYFTDNRSTVIIQDEATFTEAMDIWWFAHTEGVITVLEGGKSAIIFKDGVTLYAEIVTNNMSADVSFTKMAADPLDENYYDSVDEEGNPVDGTRFDGNEEYYKNTTEKSREGYSKLCVTATNVTSLELAVVFKVVNDQSFVPEIGTTYVWTDIDEWTAE